MHNIVRLSVIAAVALLGLTALVAAQNIQPEGAQNNPADAPMSQFAQVIGGDEAGLRELLSRVVSTSDSAPEQSVIYVTRLPDNIPFDLPLPEDAQVIGSVYYASQSRIEIILDVPQSPDDLIQFFRTSLSAGQWAALSAAAIPVGGFVSQPWSTDYFCYQTDAAMLGVTAKASETLTHVTLLIFTPADATPCGGAGTIDASGEPYSLLPQLQTPDGVTLVPGTNGIQNPGVVEQGYTGVSATLSSDLPVSKLTQAYHRQLEDAGWYLVSQEVSDKMAWSAWTLQDAEGKTWTGTFVLIPRPAVEDQYAAQVMVETMPAQP
jgi:hypothetical protein